MHWSRATRTNTRTMLLLHVVLCSITIATGLRTSRSSGTLVDFTDPKVQGHLDALVRMAQACVIKVRATPKDVRAYFTNSSPVSRSGQCFAACMLEQSDVINHGKINRELLVHLAGLVNGKNSRVVRKLNTVSRLCLDSIEGMSDRCQLASTYNDCLNENMIEFAFPLDIAEEAVRKMPFHLIQPKMKHEFVHVGFSAYVKAVEEDPKKYHRAATSCKLASGVQNEYPLLKYSFLYSVTLASFSIL